MCLFDSLIQFTQHLIKKKLINNKNKKMFEGKAMESRVGHVALVVPRYCVFCCYCCCRSKCGWVGTTRPPLISFILFFYFSRPSANSWMQQAEVVVIVPCSCITVTVRAAPVVQYALLQCSAVQCSVAQRGATLRCFLCVGIMRDGRMGIRGE